MRSRPLGRSGPLVSEIGLGCSLLGGTLDRRAADAVVGAALEAGITLFDTADVYGRGRSETALGEALAGRRDGVVIATKFGRPMDDTGRRQGASRQYVLEAAEASLRRLKTDRIDLFQLHWPDPATPVEETLEALDRLIAQGKILWAGSSNFSCAEVLVADDAARRRGWQPFISTQAEYSLLARDAERELLPALEARGIGFLPYLPLASGLLAKSAADVTSSPAGSRQAQVERLATRFAFQTDGTTERLAQLQLFAETRGRALLALALAWLLDHPAVTSVIAGASTPAQVRANAEAARLGLSCEERSELDRLSHVEVPA